MRDPVTEALQTLRATLQGLKLPMEQAKPILAVLVDAGFRLPTKAQLDRADLDARVYGAFSAIGPEGCAARFGMSRAAAYRAHDRAIARRKALLKAAA
jgi:hypothetical protein